MYEEDSMDLLNLHYKQIETDEIVVRNKSDLGSEYRQKCNTWNRIATEIREYEWYSSLAIILSNMTKGQAGVL